MFYFAVHFSIYPIRAYFNQAATGMCYSISVFIPLLNYVMENNGRLLFSMCGAGDWTLGLLNKHPSTELHPQSLICWDRILLLSTGWPWTQSLSASQVLTARVCATCHTWLENSCLFVCLVYVHTMWACRYESIHMHEWGGRRRNGMPLIAASHLYFLRKVFHWTWSLSVWLGWLAKSFCPFPSSHTHSLPPAPRLQVCYKCQHFLHMDADDLHSGPHS